jgi:bacterioferritin-associated ferredoxin
MAPSGHASGNAEGGRLMFVCLCTGVTSQAVTELVASGASTSKQIADACGAGTDCGRCRRTLRALIDAARVNGCPVHAAS